MPVARLFATLAGVNHRTSINVAINSRLPATFQFFLTIIHRPNCQPLIVDYQFIYTRGL
ncbi:hypothetical protein FD51_GL000679 [Lacticaseibacillus zeae DSM 20178 = KCTC 3804]|uniref:Uncharacterized protein n=1 Tax=Lacticaseibacillus zeae DSM 20178 = KCTC 3804 TaxID=1423816 RepID=A0A0R1EVP0_LACZE|nr:hypothetical protein [Lacticaseibacillus zeae]KRK12083.1 hypothetical protein FD51_GL000679 [Lacticaseibacillus zeae DSM 20178 = KCTC 3804]